jgi:histidinol-phosphatase (PHP family)
MALPPDGHVHSEWSWDARYGSMEKTCERAVQLGLPSVAFTEHVDHTTWTMSPEALARLSADNPLARFSDAHGRVTPPPLDVAGYLQSVERCRSRFPELHILTGVELGEPHRHRDAVDAVLAAASFDRILGSLHALEGSRGLEEPAELFEHRRPDDVLRDYLLEVAELVTGSDAFSALAHIDYPVRYWPATAEDFDPLRFEDEFRHALGVAAVRDLALEINTVLPLDATVLRWWREEGGTTVTFGSDAHEPDELARNFARAAAMAQAHGFRAPADPLGLWRRA